MSTGTPPPGPRPDAHHLPCGADVGDLLDQVAEGRTTPHDRHQAGCPHCQAALLEFADLWAPVQHLARQPVDTPAGLVTGVMRHIDRLTRDVRYTVDLADAGAVRVATRVVAAVARRAALRVPGVRVAFGRSSLTAARTAGARIRRHRHPSDAVGVLGRTAVVDLALTISYGQSARDVAQSVQRSVIAELRRSFGLHQVVVNVTVDDVSPPPPSTLR